MHLDRQPVQTEGWWRHARDIQAGGRRVEEKSSVQITQLVGCPSGIVSGVAGI